jgi:hypothetical protein
VRRVEHIISARIYFECSALRVCFGGFSEIETMEEEKHIRISCVTFKLNTCVESVFISAI